ncbi:isoprenylcysteine carboxylmethyltransferase family protein [Dinoroseobacter sp. PD6]|uniref:methyltransferase family protein n=1 Tax=Dinoroseobacter sp. PD6 TaxID=3028384 RepID=UPI00237B3A6A|nr:isoprenylcysteine carboxylmethyltransferase family protein [Dinoroseobacter sp. PD6]MDD9716075.1 isoprenylcysteine carboxylmethyltransferase family protein [Dinoroseobacter sp. PD6]
MLERLKELSLEQALDIPPLWLLICVLLGWAQARFVPVGPPGGPITDLLGGLLVGGGILLILLAVLEFRKHSTTIVPHLTPDTLITEGIFSRTRNPIYLADVLILTGLLLRWEAWLSLPLAAVLVLVLERRFVRAEEQRALETFGPAFEAYCARTRRWL